MNIDTKHPCYIWCYDITISRRRRNQCSARRRRRNYSFGRKLRATVYYSIFSRGSLPTDRLGGALQSAFLFCSRNSTDRWRARALALARSRARDQRPCYASAPRAHHHCRLSDHEIGPASLALPSCCAVLLPCDKQRCYRRVTSSAAIAV